MRTVAPRAYAPAVGAIDVGDTGHVRTIRLNRLEKKNALSNELAWAVITAVEEATRDDDVWVVAITGNGVLA